MGKFYHFTFKGCLSAILQEGLKPASQTGNQNEYLGTQGDPHYIYFWCEEKIKEIGIFVTLGVNPQITTRNAVLLEVVIDDSLIERDYDQLLYMFNEKGVKKEDLLKRMTRMAKWWGTEIKNFSEQGIKEAIDIVPEDSWRKKVGSYRTNKEIVNLKIVPWGNMVPLPFRVIGFFTRPVVWAIVKLYRLLKR